MSITFLEHEVSYEALRAMIFQVHVFWVVTSYSVVVGYQCFGGPCYIYLQGEVIWSFYSDEDSSRFLLHARKRAHI